MGEVWWGGLPKGEPGLRLAHRLRSSLAHHGPAGEGTAAGYQLLCLPLAVLAQGKVGEAKKRTQAREDPVQGETEHPFCSRHGIIWVLR